MTTYDNYERVDTDEFRAVNMYHAPSQHDIYEDTSYEQQNAPHGYFEDTTILDTDTAYRNQYASMVRVYAPKIRKVGKWLMIVSALAVVGTDLPAGATFWIGFLAWFAGFMMMRGMRDTYQAAPDSMQGEYGANPPTHPTIPSMTDGFPGVPPEQFRK